MTLGDNWLPRWHSGEESTCQCGRRKRRFDPWVGKIPWRRKGQPTPVFLPGESQGRRSLAGVAHEVTTSQTQLSTHVHTQVIPTALVPHRSIYLLIDIYTLIRASQVAQW